MKRKQLYRHVVYIGSFPKVNIPQYICAFDIMHHVRVKSSTFAYLDAAYRHGLKGS
jgi:hypothetical protein